MWVANFISTQSSPTESALDPPYCQIQESYLICNENENAKWSPIESALDLSYDRLKRLQAPFMNYQLKSKDTHEANSMQLMEIKSSN